MSRVAKIVSISNHFDKMAQDTSTNSQKQDPVQNAVNKVLGAESVAISASAIRDAVKLLKDKKDANSLSYVAKAIADMEEFIRAVKPALQAAKINPSGSIPGLDRAFE